MHETSFHYNDIPLSDKVSDIIESDFWVSDNLPIGMLGLMSDPVKFTSSVSIFVRSGECDADISLIPYHIKAPCIVNIRSDQILQPLNMSADFDASFVALSKRFTENLFIFANDTSLIPFSTLQTVVEIPAELVPEFEAFYDRVRAISADKGNGNMNKALFFTLLSFFYSVAYKCYQQLPSRQPSSQGRIADRFLQLVQQNFKRERFLDFYASRLEITPKHLSRTMKAATGYTAVEWIERYVVLEAKVMLRSSSLNIQQIADELNFPSQSFFGKYFKKCVGVSPKKYRNM